MKAYDSIGRRLVFFANIVRSFVRSGLWFDWWLLRWWSVFLGLRWSRLDIFPFGWFRRRFLLENERMSKNWVESPYLR